MAFRASRAYLAHDAHLFNRIIRLCRPYGIRVGANRTFLGEEHLVVLAEEACGADKALGGGRESSEVVVGTEGARVIINKAVVLIERASIINVDSSPCLEGNSSHLDR